MTREEALAAVAARLEKATVGNEPGVVLDRLAVEEAARLAAHADSDDVVAARLLGAFHWVRSRQLSESQERDDAREDSLRWLGRAAAGIPPGHPDRAGVLANLCAALWARFERTGEPADLDKAIELGRAAVQSAAPGDPGRAAYLTNLGAALRARFEWLDRAEDLDQAIELWRIAVTSTPVEDPGRAGFLSNLGAALQTRFRRLGGIEHLDEAIELGRAAVQSAAPGDPGRAGFVSNLGLALLARFQWVGGRVDLDDAVAAARAAVEWSPPGHPDLAAMLSNLGMVLHSRFRVLGGLPDLTEAIDIGRRLVATTEPGHPALPGRLSSVGAALRVRFESMGDVGDLDESIRMERAGVAAASRGHPDLARCLSSLGAALWARYERMGDVGDLDEAIKVGRAAVGSTESGHPAHPMRLSMLGVVLRVRFERTGELTDLDEAVWAARAAAASTPSGHADRAGYLSNLAVALILRFRRMGELGDLAEAVQVGRSAVGSTPPGHPDRATRLSNLGMVLRARFELLGALNDLDEAITLGRAAIESTASGDPGRAGRLSNLSTAIMSRFRLTGALGDLDEAIEIGRAAVESTPTDHPGRAAVLANAGLALSARWERTGDLDDREEAIAGLEEGLASPSAAPVIRMRCGTGLGRMLAGRDWVRAGRAWAAVIDLLPQVVERSLARDDRQHRLSELANVGTGAAAAAVATGDIDLAWEVLEQGRGVMLGQALDIAGDPALRRAYPELARRLDQVRRDLNAEPTGGAAGQDRSTPGAEVRRRAANEWARLVAVVRSKPGFAHFGLPPTAQSMREAAGDGVIVAINVTGDRSDALMLTPAGTAHLCLPDLKQDEAIDYANLFLRATAEPGPRSAQDMRGVLTWLWDTVAGPVLDRLDRDGHLATRDGRPPRVWWSPTGALTVLPLHAAGHHDTPGHAVLDRVLSSYTPTVRLLARARSRSAGALPVTSGVVVGVDHAPGYPPLNGATNEARATYTQVGGRTDLLLEDEAKVSAVRSRLDSASWAHFACHGAVEQDPADSHLALWDGPLPVREIAALDLGDAHLAYLSACATAFGGAQHLDEAIHIASAFQVAGFRHLVATLWPITDVQAPRLARQFYRRLASGDDPAAAVHHAVLALRDKYRDMPYLWAPYIHLGP